MKNWKHWTFAAVLAILGIFVMLVACDDGNNDNGKTYTVTIGTLTNGSITANPTNGIAGTEITLTVNPEDLYRLKGGTLKYGSTAIDETILKFILPAVDVTITAQFETIFIGSWKHTLSNNTVIIYSFFEGGIWGYGPENTYTLKGTWVQQGHDTIVLTITHFQSPGVSTLDNFTQEHETNDYENRTFKLLSNTTMKRDDNDRIFTLVE